MDKQKHTQSNANDTDFSAQVQSILRQIQKFLKEFWQFIKNTALQIGQALRELWHNFLRSFARWADPRLEPYREHPLGEKKTPSEQKTAITTDTTEEDSIPSEDAVTIKEETYAPAAPTSRDELFALLREAPMSILSSSERKIMTSLFDLDTTAVSDIMTPGHKIVYVPQSEVLGPLVLDKLYRSGFEYFPVVDSRQHIIGTLQTTHLNQLDVKETTTAENLMNPHVYYVRDDYTLSQALRAFLRTGEQLFIATDRYEKTVGLLTFRQLLQFIFGDSLHDDFARDNDRVAVAKRKTHKSSAK